MLGIVARGGYYVSRRKYYWSVRRSAPFQHRKCKSPHGPVIYTSQYVSTWSPLASTFNSRPAAARLGLNLSNKKTGLFGIDELRQPEGFYALRERALADTDRLVAESCSPNRSRKMVAIFDDLSDTLCKVADMAEFIRIAHPDNKYVTAAEEVSLSINALVERLNTNREIYESLKQVVDKGDVVLTDEVDQHVAELFLFDFEQSGIHLDEEKRSKVVRLNENILQIGALFMQGVSLARAVHKDKIPEAVRELFPHQGDKVVVSDLHADSANEKFREVAYKIFMYPDSRQENRLRDLLTAREELAHLCSFPTFAHRVLRGSLAQSPQMVIEFLDTLSKALQPYTQVDIDAMVEAKQRRNHSETELKMWDAPYLSAVIKNEKFNITMAEYMPYFSLGTCMEGLNFLFYNLYGITLESQAVDSTEIWSPEVHKLAVVDETKETLGYIYCDFLERPGKPSQDCHFTIRGGRQLQDGSYQLPIVVLMLNFPAPTWTCPSLLTPGMVENLFHEMGHAMHSMLARTKYQHVTGTRCSTDFAEVPSVLMEYFASDPRVLEHFARDYKTGKKIPYDKLLKLCQSRGAVCANDMQLQIFYAMLDQQYHGNLASIGLRSQNNNNQCTTSDILAQVQAHYYSIPHVPHTAWQHRFGHLIGYGAKYYSYLLSKAVASWIWQHSFQTDPFSRIAGERYRNEVLKFGGGRPPKEILTGFLKEEVTAETLVKSLISEIEAKQKICYSQ